MDSDEYVESSLLGPSLHLGGRNEPHQTGSRRFELKLSARLGSFDAGLVHQLSYPLEAGLDAALFAGLVAGLEKGEVIEQPEELSTCLGPIQISEISLARSSKLMYDCDGDGDKEK